MNQDQEKNRVASCHEGHTGKRHWGHMLMMVLCCLIPLGIGFLTLKVGAAFKFGWLTSLICPVMMVGMMIMMCRPHNEKK